MCAHRIMKQTGKTGPRIVSIVCESEGVNVKITLKKHIQQIFMQKKKKCLANSKEANYNKTKYKDHYLMIDKLEVMASGSNSAKMAKF